MTLLPLGTSILLVFVEKLRKAGLALCTKIHDNRVGILISEVTKPLERFHHFLSIQSLGLVKLTHPCPFRVFWLVLIAAVRVIT